MGNISTPGTTKYPVKYIPKDSEVDVVLKTGVTSGTEVNTDISPDEGYAFDIAYFDVTTPADAEANIILTTKGGQVTLLANNQSGGTEKIYDSSDFPELSGILKFTVYAKATADITSDETVVVKYSGRMVRA